MIRSFVLDFTLSATGAGTFVSTAPIYGEVLEVRVPNAGTTWTAGTADITLTRLQDGGTILNVANVTAPFQYAPRSLTHLNTSGAALTYDGTRNVHEPVAVDDHVQLVVAQGEASKAGALYVIYRQD